MHAGNFQAMHVTSSMEKTRSVLQNIGKLMFAQLTEITNYCTAPLPPNLASDTDPSLSYTMKAVDIAAAAYCSELGVLAAGNVGAHVQCAEDRNQAVNSLALISARQAEQMNEVLSMLMANYIYVLTQAVDLRIMLLTYAEKLEALVQAETATHFSRMINKRELGKVGKAAYNHVKKRFDETMREDCQGRFNDIFTTATCVPLEALSGDNLRPGTDPTEVMPAIAQWRAGLTVKARELYVRHRNSFVEAPQGEVSKWLGKTRGVYEFVRGELGVPMHRGREDLPGDLGEGDEVREARTVTTGEWITRIYSAVRDGRLAGVVGSVFVGLEGR
jgi:phenylalanine ammonia-lyase